MKLMSKENPIIDMRAKSLNAGKPIKTHNNYYGVKGSAWVVESKRIKCERGEYYHFLIFDKNLKLIAAGDEQGDYAGGVYWRSSESSILDLKTHDYLKHIVEFAKKGQLKSLRSIFSS